jgi:hypothetical protein
MQFLLFTTIRDPVLTASLEFLQSLLAIFRFGFNGTLSRDGVSVQYYTILKRIISRGQGPNFPVKARGVEHRRPWQDV